MADEAFALSPISARPALPGEADYDAIREAFMETSRGRWFLGEYAKRNRNADTAMVLDAVARIEQAMAAQRQEPARNDDQLHQALAAIRGAVEQAAGMASAALAELAPAGKLGPIHKGARIIREISWRWREIGADGRICDLIDSQLAAIEASCAEIAQADGSAALDAAFDLLRHKLGEFADGAELADSEGVTAKLNGRAGPEVNATAEAADVAPSAAAVSSAPEQHSAMPEAPANEHVPGETSFAEPEQPAETVLAAAELVVAEAEPVEAAAVTDTASEAMNVQIADAQALADEEFGEQSDRAEAVADELAEDEAVLEMVAIEMAAMDDSIDEFQPEELAEVHATVPPVVEPVVARAPEPEAAPRLEVAPLPPPRIEIAAPSPPLRLEVTPPPPTPRLDIAPAPRPQILPEPAPPVAPEPSLGATIIASGILQRPKPATDPLAPIRRMSQAEKIAFFS
jgi:hypothetical protein